MLSAGWENKYQLWNVRLQIFHKWRCMWWVSIISLTTYWRIVYFTSSLFFQYHHQYILLSLLITHSYHLSHFSFFFKSYFSIHLSMFMKVLRCGPVTMFIKLVRTWSHLTPVEVAAKVSVSATIVTTQLILISNLTVLQSCRIIWISFQQPTKTKYSIIFSLPGSNSNLCHDLFFLSFQNFGSRCSSCIYFLSRDIAYFLV